MEGIRNVLTVVLIYKVSTHLAKLLAFARCIVGGCLAAFCISLLVFQGHELLQGSSRGISRLGTLFPMIKK